MIDWWSMKAPMIQKQDALIVTATVKAETTMFDPRIGRVIVAPWTLECDQSIQRPV
jgi:hypothetical protein